jgi:hypothetical protein
MPRLTEEQIRYNLHGRSVAEMRRDLVVAFDRLHDYKNRLWFMGVVMTIEGSVIAWLATSLLRCLELGVLPHGLH